VVGADPVARDNAERVVILEEELAARVEAERTAALLGEERARPLDDSVHGVVPRCLAQLAVTSDERARQAVGRVVACQL
jgi:hypothetical protein